MNLINSKWIKYKNVNLKVEKGKDSIIIDNDKNKHAFLICRKIFKKKEKDIIMNFSYKLIHGDKASVVLMNRKKEIISEIYNDSKIILENPQINYYFLAIKIEANTKIELKNFTIENKVYNEKEILENFSNDILVITPSYPSEANKYLSGFVHSRVKAYKKSGIDVDVAVVYNEYSDNLYYTFEDIRVNRISYYDLRNVLQIKKYKKILVHFFDEKYFNVLEGCDLSNSEVFLWVHGPETLYWDYPLMVNRYFEKSDKITEEQKEHFKVNDEIIKKYNNLSNIKWIFVSEWIKKRSEELIGIKFKNYEVIPNIIDLDNFQFENKDKSKMRKIFLLRRYDNISKYAVDVSVRTILELSRRNIFNELEFNIYGMGNFREELFGPIKKFSNVKFYNKFLTHKEISKVHKENGIALFPTRYDAQGVSMCEAGASGLLVISSDNEAIKEFIPFKDGNIIDTENYIKYADFIEKIVNDEKKFNNITNDTRKKLVEKTSYDATVKKEIELIKSGKNKINENIVIPELDKNSILTVIIPAYNVEQYIIKLLKTLIINNRNSKYMEILVVNDGSKDSTLNLVTEFKNKYSNSSNSILKIIDKENGGHGSTINVGISKANGKYVRVIDGDDWVNTEDLEKLLEVLKNEDSDIVVTNYSEDRYNSRNSKKIKKTLYETMNVGQKYNFDDLCLPYYGFKTWGPILATSNIKLSKLREANFKLSEKTFYVDMEFNSYYLPVINNIVYYDLDIYRYFIGRTGQSINIESLIRNVNDHEKVIENILKFLNKTKISENKKEYLYANILKPMIELHYNLTISYMNDFKKYSHFENMLKNNLSEEEYNEFKKLNKNNKFRKFIFGGKK